MLRERKGEIRKGLLRNSQGLSVNLRKKNMEIVKAIGDLAFVGSLTAIAIAPRIVDLILAVRRKE
jgi:hypothetical protein